MKKLLIFVVLSSFIGNSFASNAIPQCNSGQKLVCDPYGLDCNCESDYPMPIMPNCPYGQRPATLNNRSMVCVPEVLSPCQQSCLERTNNWQGCGCPAIS
jgi:hypothetical protein